MPVVAAFDGIKIQFYWGEHPPPHFHVEYAEHAAVIEIRTLDLIEGWFPRPQYRKVVAWATPRLSDLMTAWALCSSDEDPGKIP